MIAVEEAYIGSLRRRRSRVLRLANVVTGSDVFRSRTSVPSELRTREWDAVNVWIRERAFFMAGVSWAETLEVFRESGEAVARGELSRAEARQRIARHLDASGYEPLPGQEGTIKDLRTLRRQNIALETNVAQVNGYARWTRQQQALRGYPAVRFVRLRKVEAPRKDWPERFATAVRQTTSAGANIPEMAALVNHPCWTRLSRFGTPYAPFDFGSGMGLEAVSRDEADALGLLPGEDAAPEHAAMLAPQNRGLNETLEATPAVRSDRVRKALSDALQGLAEWQGERLLFTDPNGTRPYQAAALAALWQRPLPDAFADLPGGGHMQREAFVEWVRNHEEFRDRNDTNKWEDMQRLHARLRNAGAAPTLYRGMSMSQAQADDFIRRVEKDGYGARTSHPVESWTNSLAAAMNFADTGGKGWRVLVEIRHADGQSFKDASPLVRSLKARIGKQSQPPVETESEWLLKIGPRFTAKIKRDQETRTLTVSLEANQ